MVDEHLTIPVGTEDDDDLNPLQHPPVYPVVPAVVQTSPFTSTLTTNPFHSQSNPMGTLVTPAPSEGVLIPNRDTSEAHLTSQTLTQALITAAQVKLHCALMKASPLQQI